MMLAHEDIALKGLEFDTMLADYVLDPTRSSHTIEEAALEHLGYKALQQEDVCGSGQRAIALPQLPAEALLNFAGERADLAWQLAGALAARLKEERLDTLFRELEMPLIPVLAAIETRGVRIDLPALASQSQRIEAELARRERSEQQTIFIAMHSFTPRFKGVDRPWHCGVLYNRDARLARPLIQLLAREGLEVGDNQPYFVSDDSDYAIPRYGERRGNLHVELELRQDLITSADQQARWASLLARVLPAAVAAHAVQAAR